MKDIEIRSDIELLIVAFYDKVKADDTIGFIFNEVVEMNWQQHIPLIVDFWESILLDNPVYKKNAMEVHYSLNREMPLQRVHFDRWLQLFNTTVDEYFTGKIALLAKTRAKSIADVMYFKMSLSGNNPSIL